MKILSDMLLIIGIMAVCLGVGMIYIPASIILCGLFLVYISYAIHKAGK